MSTKYINVKNEDDETVIIKKKHKKTRLDKILIFFYNKSDGTCCGRPPRSWGYLVVYFLGFYSVLALLFFSMIYIFMYKIVPVKVPMRTGYNSILTFTPGVNVNPRLSIESALIIGSNNESVSYHKLYVKAAKTFFNKTFPVINHVTKGINCTTSALPDNAKQFCIFNKDSLGPCADPIAELKSGRLCVFVRINKIFGWLPSVENKAMSNDTFVHCEGQNIADKNNLGKPVYYPSFDTTNSTFGVIPNIYFPFINQKHYVSPVVAVQFPQMIQNLAIIVQCSLRNLRNVYKPVKFEVMMVKYP